MAEYEALINGLCIAIELGIRRLNVQGDSQLVIDQVMKESSCHNAKMAAYCQEVCQLEDKFDGLELNHILRRLKMVSGREPVPTSVFASDQYKPSVCYKEPKQTSEGPPTLGSRAY